MTLEEILQQLESLMDSVNDHGKGVLNRVKQELMQFESNAVEPEKTVTVEEPAAVDVPRAAVDVVKPTAVVKEKPKVKEKFKPVNVVKKKKKK